MSEDKKPRDAKGKYKEVKKAEAKAAKAKPDQVIVGDPGKDDEGLYGTFSGDDQLTEQRAKQGMAEQYPTSGLSAAEAKDEMMLLRARLGDKFGKQTFKDEDAYWLLRKLEAAKDADFQAWFAREYDRMEPAQKEWARKALPRFYQQRLVTLDENLATLRQLARIRIKGIETTEDLALQYAADSGLLPMEMLQNILHPESGPAVDAKKQFKRGLFNINTYYMNERSSASSYSAATRNVAYHGGIQSRVARNWPLSGFARAAGGSDATMGTSMNDAAAGVSPIGF